MGVSTWIESRKINERWGTEKITEMATADALLPDYGILRVVRKSDDPQEPGNT